MSLPIDLSGISTTWGPQTTVPDSLRFSDVPYAPFSKGDKLGKAADWQQLEFRDLKDKKRNQRDYFHAYGASAASSFAAEAQDDGEDFEVVDNSKQVQRNMVQQATVLKGKGGRQIGGAPGGFQKKTFQQKRTFTPNNQQGGRRYWKDDKPERVRESSVKVEDSWNVVSDVELNRLTKLNFEASQPVELGSYGVLHAYNRRMEKGGVPLKTIDKNIYNPTASDDPVIQQLQGDKAATVFTTDSVVSQLMCATRSVYSWDIVVTKRDGQITLDKREGSQIDRLTVDENSADAPPDAVDANINNATKLSLEALFVNQNLVANVVSEDQTIALENANPFQTSSEPLLSKGYKYKKWELKTGEEDEQPLSIVIRTELDSKDVTSNQLLSVKAVNEYQINGLDWKTKFASQRGAIIAAELKKNNNKLSKWTQQAILAGVDTIKLGFVSRTNFKDNTKHTILGVASYSPQDLAQQINLSTGNGWGIVKSYIDIIQAQEDGKYVILRNPNKPKITVYKVPEGSFEE